MSTAVAEVREHHPAPTARRCVLIVEDDASLRDLLAGALGTAGYDVLTASDALGARQHLRSGRVHAVLLDVRLPGLSGLHVCREIRRAPVTAGLPVIMMTGDNRPDVLAAGERAGATAQLAKPLLVGDVLRQLDAIR